MENTNGIKRLVILGAGYGCRDVIELIKDINEREKRYEIVTILDDNSLIKEVDGIKVSGPLKDAYKYKDSYFVFCIGTKNSRKKRKKIIDGLGIDIKRYVTLIHPDAKVYRTAKLGYGCLVYFGTAIYSDSEIGNFCVITTNTLIGSEVHLGDYCMIGNGTVILNRVNIGESAYIASGASIVDDVSIDKYAVVGIGSVLLKNVGENQFAFGNPARVMDSME